MRFPGLLSLLSLVSLVVLVACSHAAPLDDEPGSAKVNAGGAAVKRGPIGDSGDGQLSYVFVDVENTSAKDRLVTVQGKLVGADDKLAATLSSDELRIPAHEVRTFALVADGVADEGAKPKLEVTHAVALDYVPPIELSGREDHPGDLFVATAHAKNSVDRAASVIFACTFYDAAGKILARPFTVAEMPASGEQTLRFEGPKDSAKAVLFIGQVAFKP